jgi:quercetin dioxygenase-like cupin family protein
VSFSVQETGADPRYTNSGIYVPGSGGVTKWFSGDVYSVKLTAEQTGGAVGLIEGSVPPGGGPVPHTHRDQDETFYMLSGELEFLDGEKTFIATAGDLVFCRRNIRHRFKNVGLQTAKMLAFYTPGGPEGLFLEGGDDPQPGVQVPAWGPERFQGHMLDLFEKYGLDALP